MIWKLGWFNLVSAVPEVEVQSFWLRNDLAPGSREAVIEMLPASLSSQAACVKAALNLGWRSILEMLQANPLRCHEPEMARPCSAWPGEACAVAEKTRLRTVRDAI